MSNLMLPWLDIFLLQFSGNLEGTFYIDDLQLLATPRQGPRTMVTEQHNYAVLDEVELSARSRTITYSTLSSTSPLGLGDRAVHRRQRRSDITGTWSLPARCDKRLADGRFQLADVARQRVAPEQRQDLLIKSVRRLRHPLSDLLRAFSQWWRHDLMGRQVPEERSAELVQLHQQLYGLTRRGHDPDIKRLRLSGAGGSDPM